MPLHRGSLSRGAVARHDTEGQRLGHDPGAAGGAGRLRRCDGRRAQRRAEGGPRDYAQIPALVERSKIRVANFCSDIDARLAEVPFVAGEHFSAADITTLMTVDFATRALNLQISTESVALKRWYDAVAARPNAAA